MNHDNNDDELADIETAERLYDLAEDVPPGPWNYKRSNDGQILIWAGDEPLAHVYGGIDLAKWICATSPARLLGGHRGDIHGET